MKSKYKRNNESFAGQSDLESSLSTDEGSRAQAYALNLITRSVIIANCLLSSRGNLKSE